MAPISITIDAPTAAEIAALQAAANGLAGTSASMVATPGSGGTTPPTTTPPATTPPASGNVYPLAMPANVTAGAAVTLGTGPNTIVINAANTPSQTPASEFVVIGYFGATPTALAGPLTVSSYSGESVSGTQIFTIKGDFTGLTSLEIASSGAGIGGLWIDQLTVDLIPWQTNTDAINSRGTGTPVYATLAFNSNGANETWLPATAIPAAPVPPPATAPTVVSGATIGGTVQAPSTLAALLSATPVQGMLVLPGGVISGASAIPYACTVGGAGMGNTIIDGTGIQPDQDKGLLVPSASGTTISNMTLRNASISAALGNNAAGVREGGAGVSYTLNAVEITGCQDGILASASNVTLIGGHTHDNGAGDGFTHEIYLSAGPANVCSLSDWVSTCGMKSTHALKTRAGTTTVKGGTFTGSPDTTGNVGGSVIDVSNGGVFSMTGSTVVLAAGAANHNFLTYGLESNANAQVGQTVTLTNVVFTDNTGSGGVIAGDLTNMPQAKLVLSGCTYTGTTAPSISGFASVTGTIAKA